MTCKCENVDVERLVRIVEALCQIQVPAQEGIPMTKQQEAFLAALADIQSLGLAVMQERTAEMDEIPLQ